VFRHSQSDQMPECPRNLIAVACQVTIPFIGGSQQGGYLTGYAWFFRNNCFHIFSLFSDYLLMPLDFAVFGGSCFSCCCLLSGAVCWDFNGLLICLVASLVFPSELTATCVLWASAGIILSFNLSGFLKLNS